MKRLYVSIVFILFTAANVHAERTLRVHAVNYPLQYLAERIGAEHIEIVRPVPADADPAFWRPGAKEIVEIQSVDLILLNGANYAKWIKTASLPRKKMVNTSAALKKKYIYEKNAVTHTHGPGGEHAHETLAFTTWMDLELAIAQAEAISAAFSKAFGEHEKCFAKNLDALKTDLKTLDQNFRQVLAQHGSTPVVASHPVYQYFARAYGLNLKSVHWEPGRVPSAKELAELQVLLASHPAKWMIWEGEPKTETVALLEGMGLKCVVVSPAGAAPTSGDFLSAMNENVDEVKTVYGEASVQAALKEKPGATTGETPGS